jgi:hypothetical protein
MGQAWTFPVVSLCVLELGMAFLLELRLMRLVEPQHPRPALDQTLVLPVGEPLAGTSSECNAAALELDTRRARVVFCQTWHGIAGPILSNA